MDPLTDEFNGGYLQLNRKASIKYQEINCDKDYF